MSTSLSFRLNSLMLLSALSLSGCGDDKASRESQQSQALQEITLLVRAVQSFYDEYNHYPDVPSIGSLQGVSTDAKVMDILLGQEDAVTGVQNGKQITYFEHPLRDGKEPLADSTLHDPWGNPYRVTVDTLGFGAGKSPDEVILDPFTKKPLYGRLTIAWSMGPDGKFDLDNSNAKVNEDNVYSWR